MISSILKDSLINLNQIKKSSMAEYIPGKQNIGTLCRMVRAFIGIIAIICACFALGLMIKWNLPIISRILLVFPLFIGYLDILQAIYGFSTQHAIRGIYDLR
jgi:hypothetical protein